MKGGLALVGHSLKRVRALVLVMGILLAAFQVLMTLVARSIHRSGGFQQIAAMVPGFVRQLIGPSFAGLLSFQGVVCVGYFHLAVMGALVGLAIALATAPASEVETGFMDLILSRPLARQWVITRTGAVLVLGTSFVLASMLLGTWSALHWLAPAEAERPSARLLLDLVLNLGALVLAWGGVALFLSSLARRRSVAGSQAGLLALATFLLDYVARVWTPAQSIAWLSPFRYYNPLDRILGLEVPVHHLLVLLGIAVSATALAYLAFARRDL